MWRRKTGGVLCSLSVKKRIVGHKNMPETQQMDDKKPSAKKIRLEDQMGRPIQTTSLEARNDLSLNGDAIPQ